MVGSRLVGLLVNRGESVRALVHDIRPSSVLNSIRTITPDVVAGDVRKPTSLNLALQDVSVVYHLAAVSHLSRNRDLYETNTQGTANLLEASLSRGVKRFIYVSSVAAAGHNVDRHTPMTEDAPARPCTDYGRSRLLAEELMNEAHLKHGLKTTILRPCWIYGPGPGISPRMERFLRAIRDGRMPLFGGGNNLTSMTYVDHLVAALLLASSSKNAIGQTYFIADEGPYAMVEIYGAVTNALGIPLRAVNLPVLLSRACEIPVQLADRMGMNMNTFRLLSELRQDISVSIAKAKQEIGYRPSMTLEEGMKETVTWCKAEGLL